MKNRKDPRDLAREKMQNVDQGTMGNLQNMAGQYATGPVTPQNLSQFAKSIDEKTLADLSRQLGVHVNPQVMKSLTPEKVQELLRMIEQYK